MLGVGAENVRIGAADLGTNPGSSTDKHQCAVFMREVKLTL